MSEGKIFKAINGVMSEVGAIGKDKTNTQQGFKYRGIDDVMNALQPMLVKHGVFVVPEVLDQLREERTSKHGASLIYSVCKIKYTFFAEDGSNVTAITIGEGMDSGDKATNKAMAIAFKYACFQVFCIPTEEMKDPDSECHEVKPQQQASKQQENYSSNHDKTGFISAAQVNRLFAKSGGNKELCREVAKKYGYEKSSEIKIADYNRICNEVESRAKTA